MPLQTYAPPRFAPHKAVQTRHNPDTTGSPLVSFASICYRSGDASLAGARVPGTTKIVAISGSGRSGSTLLGLVLAQSEGTFNLGQLRHLWGAWRENAECSCGQPLQSCAVYGELVPKVLAAAGFDDARGAQRAVAAFHDDAARLRDWADPTAREGLAAKHARFLSALGLLLAQLRERTAATTFIDSSKTPEMALAFDLLAGSETRVINLIRDPRAVACSWYRKSPGYRSLWRNMRAWRSRQHRLDAWRTALGPRFLPFRYEDFAARPRPALAEAAAFAGLSGLDQRFTEADRVTLSWENQHIYPPANETVLAERRSDVTIRPAESWKDPSNRGLHRFAIISTWPLGQRLYPGA